MRFSDERYAEYQLKRCNADQRTFNVPLTVLSIATSALVLLVRIRHEEYRKFPDNAFAATLCTLCGLHGSMLVTAVTKSKVVLLQTQPWPTVCKVQATLIHWFTCAAVWTFITVMVTIYLIVVRQVSVQTLAKLTRSFYASLLLIPSAAVTACWCFGGYGPFPGLDNCWINQGIDRVLYFHTFTILGVVICLTLGPITGLSLWRAYRGALNRADYARVFRTMLIRQVLLACYGFVMSVAFLLGGVNTLYLKIDPDAHKTWYIKRTAYTYCMVSAVNFSTLGLFVSMIFFSTKSRGRALLAALRRVCGSAHKSVRAWFSSQHGLRSAAASPSGLPHTRSKRELSLAVMRESKPMTSPRSPGGRLLFPSAFDSGGQTALSVPPDPRARRVQQQAASAYTSTLLEYAREQLLEESFVSDDDSDVSTSSSLSSACSVTSSNGSFLDSLHLQQQHEPLDDLVFATEAESETMLQASPRVTPYYLHCDGDDDDDDARSVLAASDRRTHALRQAITLAHEGTSGCSGTTTEL